MPMSAALHREGRRYLVKNFQASNRSSNRLFNNANNGANLFTEKNNQKENIKSIYGKAATNNVTKPNCRALN